MYSVWIVERVYCLDYDIGSVVEGVCASPQAAERYIKTLKDEHFKRTGEKWNEDMYHQGRLTFHEHYLHTKGERP